MPDNSHFCDVWRAHPYHRKILLAPRSNRVDLDRIRRNPSVRTKSGPKRRQIGRVSHKNISHKKAHQAQKENMKMKTMFFMALFLLLGTVSQARAQEEFNPITVFLIRHAEKEDEPRQDPPLKKEGIARSQELAHLLSGAGIKAIFTSQFARTKQTAEPLATKLGLTVASFTLKSNPSNPRQIAVESTAEVTNKILERAGESVLVIGHSNSIP